MSVVICHNQDCGTSHNPLAILRAAGTLPAVIDHLKTGWTRAQHLGLFAAAGLKQGKTLAVMQVSRGSQSFNAVNQMCLPGV